MQREQLVFPIVGIIVCIASASPTAPSSENKSSQPFKMHNHYISVSNVIRSFIGKIKIQFFSS